MINFSEINNYYIVDNHPKYFHENARYFQIIKDKCNVGFYGLIDYTDKVCDVFWLMDTFKGKVFTKDFFKYNFDHLFSLDYKTFYTWSKQPKVIRIFDHCKNFGIERSENPFWDNDKTKTWFIRRA